MADYYQGGSGRADFGSTGGVFGKSAMSSMWSAIQTNAGWTGGAPSDAIYRQFTSRGGRMAENAAIPTQGARIVPVIATQSGTGPEGKSLGEWRRDRMNAPMGFAVKNPDAVYNYAGITSTYAQGRMDPNRKQLYGRLGATSSATLKLHPELYKPLPGGHPSQKPYEKIAKGYSLINAPHAPSIGTAEGSRYWETVRKEVAGANMVFDPLAGQWGSRNQMRWKLNRMMTPGSVENEAMLTGMSLSDIRKARERAAYQQVFKGYSPDLSWVLRLKQGQFKESGSTKDKTPATIETYEGTQRLGETTVSKEAVR